MQLSLLNSLFLETNEWIVIPPFICPPTYQAHFSEPHFSDRMTALSDEGSFMWVRRSKLSPDGLESGLQDWSEATEHQV